MSEVARLYDSPRRRSFIGGSDARIIMEAAAEKHMAQVQHNMGLPMQWTRCSRSFATWALLKSVSTSVRSLRGVVVLPSGMDCPADAWPMPQLQR
jgi:hypothetical protein